MDGLIILILAVILCIKNSEEEIAVQEILQRETALNSTFYHDDNAFMEVANVLGFSHTPVPVRGDTVSDMRVPRDIQPDTESNVRPQNNRFNSDLENVIRSRGSRFRRMADMERSNNSRTDN